jgi:hypothetical protein
LAGFVCPNCGVRYAGADWYGRPILRQMRRHYSPPAHIKCRILDLVIGKLGLAIVSPRKPPHLKRCATLTRMSVAT